MRRVRSCVRFVCACDLGVFSRAVVVVICVFHVKRCRIGIAWLPLFLCSEVFFFEAFWNLYLKGVEFALTGVRSILILRAQMFPNVYVDSWHPCLTVAVEKNERAEKTIAMPCCADSTLSSQYSHLTRT